MSKPSIIRSAFLLIRSRVEAIFIWSWATTVTCMIVGRGYPPLVPSLLAVCSIAFISISVYVYNDIIDMEIDKINEYKKNRPLPSGEVTVEQARTVSLVSGIIGLAMGLATNIYTFLFELIYFVLFTIYSYPRIHLKKKFLLKELVVTSGVFLTCFAGSYALTNQFSPTAFFSTIIFATVSFVGQPAFNDTYDIEADRVQGVKSLASVLSWRRKMQIFILGVLFIMTVTPLTYVRFGFNMLLPIYAVLGSLVFLRYLMPITDSVENVVIFKIRKVAYVYFVLLHVVTIVATLDLNLLSVF